MTRYNKTCYLNSNSFLNKESPSFYRPGVLVSKDTPVQKLNPMMHWINGFIPYSEENQNYSNTVRILSGVYYYDGDQSDIESSTYHDYLNAWSLLERDYSGKSILTLDYQSFESLILAMQKKILYSDIIWRIFDKNFLGIVSGGAGQIINKSTDLESQFWSRNFKQTLSFDEMKIYDKLEARVRSLEDYNPGFQSEDYWKQILILGRNQFSQKTNDFIDKHYKIIGSREIVDIQNELKKIFDEIKIIAEQDCLDGAIALHQKFVDLHPFGDGNGRVSRLLMEHELKNCGFSKPEYISAAKYNHAIEQSLQEKSIEPFKEYLLTSVCRVNKEKQVLQDIMNSCQKKINDTVTTKPLNKATLIQDIDYCLNEVKEKIEIYREEDKDQNDQLDYVNMAENPNYHDLPNLQSISHYEL